MRSLSAAVGLIMLVTVAACTPYTGNDMECPDPPSLASSEQLPYALSCAEALTFDGAEYFVGCAPVHRSRVGGVLADDGGETSYSGARAAVGVPPSKVLLLEGGGRGVCRGGTDRVIASSDSFTRRDAGLLRVPVGAPNEDELAHDRAPWIVPGRNEYPEALKLDAELSADGVTVTNRNRFAWRNCDQIQINDEVDEIWETGQYLDRLAAGASHTWTLDAFGGDHHGLEALSEESLDEARGEPFIIMCRAPGGRAFGRDIL